MPWTRRHRHPSRSNDPDEFNGLRRRPVLTLPVRTLNITASFVSNGRGVDKPLLLALEASCNEAWPRFLTDAPLIPIICGKRRRRERCSQDRGIERELWAREQLRKESRKGKSLKPLPKKRREQLGEWKWQQPRVPHVALCILPIVVFIHSSNDPIETEPDPRVRTHPHQIWWNIRRLGADFVRPFHKRMPLFGTAIELDIEDV
jgi:hypothetical protein